MKADRMLSGPAASSFDQLTRRFRRTAPSPVSSPGFSEADSLDAFAAETSKPGDSTAPGKNPNREPRRRRTLAIIAVIVLVAAAGAAFPFVQARLQPLMAEESRPGRVTFETQPVGAQVVVDGHSRGNTPLTIELPAGMHAITIREGAEERFVPLQIAAGTVVTQHFEFLNPPAVAVGKLTIATDPSGARVTIDGQPSGTSPVTVEVTSTPHRVVVSNDSATAERTITTEPGVLSSIVFSLGKTPGVSAGWLSVAAPFEVQVLEDNEVLGTSATAKFMISTGRHEVELVNPSLDYREHRRLEIEAGKTTALRLDAKGTINVNARPWAEVTIDGNAAGQTPISNATISIGTHQIVFRHPEFGERRQSVVVTAKGPNRVGVDMTK